MSMLRRAVGPLVGLYAALMSVSAGVAQSATSIDMPLLVTYGNKAPIREGDPTFRQVIYISLPADLKERVYIRLFDPDTGGDHDLIYTRPDTTTRFALFGGDGAFAGDEATGRGESEAELTGGKLLREKTYSEDNRFDGQWSTFALVSPSQGEEIEGRRVFRLLVEGLDGNDGNLYGVVASLRDRRNLEPEDVRLFSFAPTIRVPNRSTLTELRFDVPDGQDTLTVDNFDAAHGHVALTTRFRSLKLRPSGQGNWSSSAVTLTDGEQGEKAAITLKGGGEMPNDATFYIAVRADRLLPLDLPPFNWVPNRRPVIRTKTTFLDSCRAISFDASQTTDQDGHRLKFLWRFSDGSEQSGPSVVKDYAAPGRFTERLEVTDNSGQIGSGSDADIPVLVKFPPVPNIQAPAVVGTGEAVVFDASASDATDWQVTHYEWLFNDGQTAHGRTVTRHFDKPGTYGVSLRIRDNSGHACDSASIDIPVRVNAAPVAEAGPDIRTEVGTKLTFDGSDSYDTDGAIVAHRWDLGDGASAEKKTVVHAYRAPGTYTATLTVADDANVSNSQASDSATIRVNAPPVPVAGDDRSVAIGEVISFDAGQSSDSDGRIIAYDWDFGAGPDGVGKTVEFAYAKPGTYTVRLTVTDDSGTGTKSVTDTLTVRVNAPPVAAAGDDQWVTASAVQFDASGSSDADDQIETYEWDFGDGTTGTGVAPSHVYRKPGTYIVRLTVTDASGTLRNSSSDTMQVIINTPPIADAGPDLFGAPGEELTFQASRSVDPDGDIVDYTWDFKDGTTGSGEIATHAFEKPGTYYVRLKVADETGHDKAVDYDETEVVINAQPIADAGDDILVAPGQMALLDASRSYDSDGEVTDFRWDIDGQEEPVFAKTHQVSFDTPGVYTATLTIADDSGAENSLAEDQVTIRVNHRPVAEAGQDVFTARSFVLFDGSASTDADGDGLNYVWDFGDGNTATGAVVAHTYADGGTYPVVLTVSDGNGLENSDHRDAMTVRINHAPIAVAGENQRICTGDILVLDGSKSYDPEGGVLKYVWDFGDGKTADIVNPTTSYRRDGVYEVTLAVKDDSGLSNATHADQIAVTVDQAPVADGGPDMKVCANTEVFFDGSGSWDADGVVNRFLWDFGDGGSSGGDKPKHIYRRAGTYRARLTIEGDQVGQCDTRATDEVVVEVTAAPVPLIEALDVVPVGTKVAFDGSTSYLDDGVITGWSWDFADGTTAEGALQNHVFEKAGVYRVALTVDSTAESAECRQISAYHLITVNDAPVAEAGEDIVAGINEEILLDASGSSDPDDGISSYVWDLGDGTIGEGIEFRHRYTKPGVYEVKLSVTDTAGVANSTSTDTVRVTILDGATAVLDMPSAVCVGELAEFSAAKSASLEAPIVAYRWSMGDGTTSTAESLTKRYVNPGKYTVSVLVDDGLGRASSTGEAASVLHVNRSPIAVAGRNRYACPGVPVRFDASASSDPDGNISSVNWSFGDGGSGEGMTPEHTFDKPGTYEVEMKVTDNSGASCSTQTDKLTVIVNAPPSADAGPDREVFIGGANDAELFSGWRSYDPDGTDLAHVWDFGADGQRQGERVSHAFGAPGDYDVTLTVTDGTGLSCGTASDTMRVKVRTREGS